MINKRGLSPIEFEQVDDELFQYLMVYDTFVDPSGARYEMLKHAHLCQTITLNNSHMTKSVASNIKITDYDFLGILEEGTRSEKQQQKQQEQESRNNDFFASRMKQIKGKK